MFQDFTSNGVRIEREPREQRRMLSTDFGVVVVRTPTDPQWKPRTCGAIPPLRSSGLPFEIANHLVIGLNRQMIEQDRRRWCVVVRENAGYGVLSIVLHVVGDRPEDPSAWYPTMKLTDVTRSEATAMRSDLNKSILATAYVPKIWSLVIRRPVESAVVAGV